MQSDKSMTALGPCFCDDGSLAAAVVYRVRDRRGNGGLQLHPLAVLGGHGHGTYDHPVGLTGADRVVCLNSFGGVAWAHLASTGSGHGCLVRLESGETAVPKVSVDLAVSPQAERAFAEAGLNPADFRHMAEWRG